MTENKIYHCVICGEVIRDHGVKFCTKCRKMQYKVKHQGVKGTNQPPEPGYETLAAYIIKQARKDYFHRRHRRYPYRKDCIRFFKSEWFYVLSGLDGRAMLEELERITE